MTYDCTEDVKAHIRHVKHYLSEIILELVQRSKMHDSSKLGDAEKPLYDQWTPKLKEYEFGSEEYKAALVNMGSALQHHYQNNSHHPEHYENGIAGMTLADLVEMVCDWKAASYAKGQDVNLEYLAERFGIEPQLLSIIRNSMLWPSSAAK